MKFLIKTLLAISLLFFSVEILLAKKIDNSRIKMLNGEYAKLSDFHSDGPLIINFWTTWWPFCERQLAYLDQLNSNFKDAGLNVLAVNVNKPNILKHVAANYIKYKDSNNLIDFTDMIHQFIQKKNLCPQFDVVFVDEAQDLSPIQWQMFDILKSNIN